MALPARGLLRRYIEEPLAAVEGLKFWASEPKLS
jgi:hypothetical protein